MQKQTPSGHFCFLQAKQWPQWDSALPTPENLRLDVYRVNTERVIEDKKTPPPVPQLREKPLARVYPFFLFLSMPSLLLRIGGRPKQRDTPVTFLFRPLQTQCRPPPPSPTARAQISQCFPWWARTSTRFGRLACRGSHGEGARKACGRQTGRRICVESRANEG